MAINNTIVGIGVDSAADNGKSPVYNSTTKVFDMATPSGGGGGAWTLIESQSPTTATTTFNTDIGTYNLYKIFVRIENGGGSADAVYVRFNGDTTAANYFWKGTYSTNGSTAVTTEKALTDAEGVKVSNAFEGNDGIIGEITIIKISSGEAHVRANFDSLDDGANVSQHQYGGIWEQTTALSSIIVDVNGGSVASGSQIILMGAN